MYPCGPLEVLHEQVDVRVRMELEPYRTEVRAPNAVAALVTVVVHDSEFEGDCVILVRGAQPAVYGRAMIALVENIGPLLTVGQSKTPVDSPQRISQNPAPQGNDASGLVSAITHSGQGVEA